MLKPILVCSFVAVVILGECLLAWFLIPSTSDVEAWAKEKAAESEKHEPAKTDAHGEHAQPGAKHGEAAKDGHDKHDAHHGDPSHEPGHHEVEIELGKFSVVIHEPSASSTMRINFFLIGILSEEQHVEFDELLAKNQHRLRDQVIFEIRNSRVEDLTDPGLGLLKRKILAKTNDLLGKPILRTVVFSDFAFIEQ